MTDIAQWELYAARRISTHNGDVQRAWFDVLKASALRARRTTSRQENRVLSAAITGFVRANTCRAYQEG